MYRYHDIAAPRLWWNGLFELHCEIAVLGLLFDGNFNSILRECQWGVVI